MTNKQRLALKAMFKHLLRELEKPAQRGYNRRECTIATYDACDAGGSPTSADYTVYAEDLSALIDVLHDARHQPVA